MGKLFMSNFKDATSRPSESDNNAYALGLAETAAEFKIAMLRTSVAIRGEIDLFHQVLKARLGVARR